MAPNKPRWAGTTALTITPESGSLTLGERTLFKQILEGTYANAKAGILPRGYFGTAVDRYGMLGWVVSSCELQSIVGTRGKLTINWEPGGPHAWVPLPCDDFRMERLELYPRVERHEYFNQTTTGTGPMEDIDIETVSLVYSAVHGSSKEARAAAYQQLESDALVNDQGKLGLELVDMLRRGEETFYLVGQKFTWSFFSYVLPATSKGAIIQAPFGPGSVPSALDPELNWLRLADELEPVGVNGSMYKLTRTWLGGPQGHWDKILYK